MLQARQLEVLPTQPQIMGARPGLTTGIDDPLPQQQLGDPMAGAHQIGAGILTGTHQVPRRFLRQGRDLDLDDLAQLEQPRQMQRVMSIGLDPIPGRTCATSTGPRPAP